MYPQMVVRQKDVQAEYRLKDSNILGNFLILKSSYELYGKSRPTHKGDPLWVKGLPDVFNHQEMSGTDDPDYIPLTENLQHWFLFLNITRFKGVKWTKKQYYEWFNTGSAEVVWAAKELSRALADDRSHTNKWGMNNAKNFLTKETNREGLPQFMKIITGWCRLKLYNGKLELRNVAGVGRCVAFHAIDASQDVWQFNSWEHLDRMDEPMVTAREVVPDAKGAPKILRDDLHLGYGNFGNKLIFPKLLLGSDKSYVYYDWTRLPYPGETLEKQWKS